MKTHQQRATGSVRRGRPVGSKVGMLTKAKCCTFILDEAARDGLRVIAVRKGYGATLSGVVRALIAEELARTGGGA